MNDKRVTTVSFSEADIERLAAPMKIGILATINEEGLPHLTLITTLQASSPNELIWGQFTEGLSKDFVKRNPKTGFLVMTLDKSLWRGKARWDRIAKTGPEFDLYNNLPMFRYNAYFGVHTVHYMDLIEYYGQESLSMPTVVAAAVKTLAARSFSRRTGVAEVLNPWTRTLLDNISNLKFLSYIEEDGYPKVIPAIQAQTLDTEHVILAVAAYSDELRAIPSHASVALFGMSMDMEDVLLRGIFQGIRRIRGIQCGVIKINWVYNSMPPKPQQIYPAVEIEPVINF
jgi:hypothetical protein